MDVTANTYVMEPKEEEKLDFPIYYKQILPFQGQENRHGHLQRQIEKRNLRPLANTIIIGRFGQAHQKQN
jgi:hypothetical protein